MSRIESIVIFGYVRTARAYHELLYVRTVCLYNFYGSLFSHFACIVYELPPLNI